MARLMIALLAVCLLPVLVSSQPDIFDGFLPVPDGGEGNEGGPKDVEPTEDPKDEQPTKEPEEPGNEIPEITVFPDMTEEETFPTPPEEVAATTQETDDAPTEMPTSEFSSTASPSGDMFQTSNPAVTTVSFGDGFSSGSGSFPVVTDESPSTPATRGEIFPASSPASPTVSLDDETSSGSGLPITTTRQRPRVTTEQPRVTTRVAYTRPRPVAISGERLLSFISFGSLRV